MFPCIEALHGADGVVPPRILVLVGLLTLLCTVGAGTTPPAQSCESLATLLLPDTTITLAKTMPAGDFVAPPVPFAPANITEGSVKGLPAFCRVAATLRPTSDSSIGIEVWMPVADWNGRFGGVGNGGWAGGFSWAQMGAALKQNYATASTDTGHKAYANFSTYHIPFGQSTFALGHPEKLIDYSERAVHLMMGQAKSIVAAYNGTPPQYMYWNGCSCGGRQGLVEAQRYPHDYNGIAAGDPPNDWVDLMFSEIWRTTVAVSDPDRGLTAGKRTLLENAVMAACDALDGIKDNIINGPTQCHFDPGTLACKGADGPDCLTAPQVEAARMFYAGPRNPRTGRQIFPGLGPGSESGWPTQPNAISNLGQSYFQFVLFKNPERSYRSLNYDRDVTYADRVDPCHLDALDPNLKVLRDSGVKLLQYHGWSDPLIAPGTSLNYYQRVLKAMGGREKTKDFYRLFMLPGVLHCDHGPGPDTFDKVGVLREWVEHGTLPDNIIAAHYTNGVKDMTRPLCPYPEIAKWKGTGSTNDATDFVCAMPEKQ